MNDASHLADENYGPPAPSEDGWKTMIAVDLEREISDRTPLQKVVGGTRVSPPRPLRMALSAVRDELDRRSREWRSSAQIVEQTLRQLAAAEQARANALRTLAQIEAEVAITGETLTAAMAAFDEAEGARDIAPLFAQSEASLEALDRVANEVLIAQHWCRQAWNTYAEALENERHLRHRIQLPGRAA